MIYQYDYFYIYIDKINQTMTIQQLRYIVAIDRFHHFGKAAEAFDLTQSTLSLMVKKLEDELDVRIFDRDSHPIASTPIGRAVIDQAKVVLYNVEQLTEMTKKEKDLVSGHLTIAMISTAAPVLVTGLFKHLASSCPDLTLVTEEMLSSTIVEKLTKTEVDMGILSDTADIPGLLSIPLYHERFFAYVSEKDPYYTYDKLTYQMIRKGKGWIMKDGLRFLDASARETDDPFSYDRYFEGSRVGTLIQMVNENGGITIIPETHINLIPGGLHKHLRPIVEPQLSRRIVLVIRQDYIHEAKLNAVIKAIRDIIPEKHQEDYIKTGPIRI